VRYLFVISLVVVLIAQAEMLTRTKVLMGTFVSLSLDESHKALFKGSFNVVHRVDNSLSSFKKTSPIYKLNQNRKADINLYTYEALQLSQQYYKKTAGYFNIAVGGITKDLYRFGKDERVPKEFELNKCDISFTSLHFDEKEATLGQGVKIDLGGMGKGFGVDRVREYLKANNITKARIALSGDIRCLGICKIEINNPNGATPLMTFQTKESDMGITTSGNYNHFVDSKEHNHLINPKTKHSEQNFSSITLISKLPSSDLDAYATAASVMPRELAFKFLKSLPLAYVVLLNDNTLVVSKNINLFVDDTPKE